MSFARLAGFIKTGAKEGIAAAKAGASIVPIHPDIFKKLAKTLPEEELKQMLIERDAARLANAVSSPQAYNTAIGSGVGMALGQNPIAAIGSSVGGNYVGEKVGGYLRRRYGDDSLRVGIGQTVADLGTSIVSGEVLSKIFGGAPTETREAVEFQRRTEEQLREGAAMNQQRYAPAQGTQRQFADMAMNQAALQRPIGPEGGRTFADQQARSMVLPVMDAATADKLRKRAIENAQQGFFLADGLNQYIKEVG